MRFQELWQRFVVFSFNMNERRPIMKRVLVIVMAFVLIMNSAFARSSSRSGKLNLDSGITLGAYQGMVEEHLAGILHTAHVIASSPEAASGNWTRVRPMLERFGSDLSTDATVWYALADGSYYTTESGTLSGQNLRDRSYFPGLMAGRDVLGELVVSKSTGFRSVVVASPVMSGGKMVAAIGVSVRVDLLSKMVDAALSMPEGVYFYALIPDTRIALHRYADRMFRTVSDVGDERLGSAFREVMNKDHGAFDYTLDGKRVSSIFRRSPILGWYFFIARQQS